MGDKSGAIKAAKEGINISKEIKDDEYLRLNQAVLPRLEADPDFGIRLPAGRQGFPISDYKCFSLK